MVLFVLEGIYGYKRAIIITEVCVCNSVSVCVCVLRPPIKLSGCVEETVPVSGTVKVDSVCFVLCLH